MTKLRRKGFTLIELIAVLVIMAILALIVTPLVMNIIRKAKLAADKRSIDAYGRSIELAIAGYLLDTGKFPTSVGDLSIEYSGDEVICSITQLNDDSSVYLTGCTVKGRTVDYAYGTDKSPSYTVYSIGDHISYNGVTYYVIEDSGTTNDTVKLLKENPLTKTEMDNLNLTGITITESNGYGTVQYGPAVYYSMSTVKQVVDKWAESAVKSGDSATERLITFDEIHTLGYSDTPISCGGPCQFYSKPDGLADWVYNSNYNYWTMTYFNSLHVWKVYDSGGLYSFETTYVSNAVRPVLEISKTADLTKLDS